MVFFLFQKNSIFFMSLTEGCSAANQTKEKKGNAKHEVLSKFGRQGFQRFQMLSIQSQILNFFTAEKKGCRVFAEIALTTQHGTTKQLNN